jgi:hypothetical protein
MTLPLSPLSAPLPPIRVLARARLTTPPAAGPLPIAFVVLAELLRLIRAALPHKRDVFRAALTEAV